MAERNPRFESEPKHSSVLPGWCCFHVIKSDISGVFDGFEMSSCFDASMGLVFGVRCPSIETVWERVAGEGCKAWCFESVKSDITGFFEVFDDGIERDA